MSRNSWALFTTCLLVATGIGQRREAEAFEPNPIIAINVEDPNGLAGPGLVRAEELASEIYQQAGVTLRWTVDETKADTTLTVVITTSVTAPLGLTSDSMGVAPSPGDGTRGTIADGAGFNTLEATRLYLKGLADGDVRAGAAGKVLIADGQAFTATAQSVYPLDNRTTPVPGETGLAQNPTVIYDPAKNYDFTSVPGLDPNGQPRAFAGYEWNRNTYPDSGNTASSIATGGKTYNNAIDVDGNGANLFSIAELAKQQGKATGVVTTVQFSDATPSATGGAHNTARSNANQIATGDVRHRHP